MRTESNMQNKLQAFIGRMQLVFSNNRVLKLLRRYAPFLMLALFLVALFYFIPVENMVSVFRQADLKFFLYGLLIIIPFLFFEALQLSVLIVRQGMYFPVLSILRTNLKIRFYQLFAPGSFVGGGIRLYNFAQATNQPTKIFVVLAYNRLYNIALTLVFGAIYWIAGSYNEGGFNVYLLMAFTGLSVVALLILPFVSNFLSSKLQKRFGSKEKTSNRWVYKKLYDVLVTLSSFSNLTWVDQLKMIFFIFMGQVTALLSYYWLAVSLGIHLSLADMGWIRSVILLSLYLPVNASAGLTMREVGFAALLIAIGVKAELAGAYSLLILGRSNLIALCGGLIELLGSLTKKWSNTNR